VASKLQRFGDVGAKEMTMRNTLLAGAVAVLAMWSAEAHADLVANGGFETNGGVGSSTFASWTAGAGISVDSTFVHSGNFDAAFGGDGALTQSITATAGQNLTLSFALLDESGLPTDSFAVSFGSFSTTIVGDPSLTSYNVFSFTVPGADNPGASTLQFQGTLDANSPQAWNLDDVSLTPVSTPEPMSIALFGAGLLGFGALRRRK
jgi:hypothetical protein